VSQRELRFGTGSPLLICKLNSEERSRAWISGTFAWLERAIDEINVVARSICSQTAPSQVSLAVTPWFCGCV